MSEADVEAAILELTFFVSVFADDQISLTEVIHNAYILNAT